MATYYPSSSNQRDAASMLYVREPLPNSYAEAPVLPGNMMMYVNYPPTSGSYSDAMAVNSEQQNKCFEIPSVGASDSNQPQQQILSNFGGSRIGEHDYGSWRDGRNEMLLMHSLGAPSGISNGNQNLQGQGLSLSLSTQIPTGIQIPSVQFRNPTSAFSSFLSPHVSVAAEEGSRNGSYRDDESSFNKQSANAEFFSPGFHGGNQDSKVDPSLYGMSTAARVVPSSKYLKAAQQLLDEVVNVRNALRPADAEKKNCKEAEGGLKDGATSPSVCEGPPNLQESAENSQTDLSASERQELQNKLTKLLSMLDEVDRKYKQYYHQMQIVVSSFDVIAGNGAAKPYTALALQTISRHFRCLRDAISGQVRVTRKNLGEQDISTSGKGVGISRLRYVDQQLRQQRALQQLGMMQQHTWRPQRGLPETSVSILRAWLFEHFLHPYPKDSDKIMLARQTGLTRSQVSNWFINARVRLWKPMVEDMYKEEFGDADMDSNSSSENASKATRGERQASEDRGRDGQQSTTSTAANRCAGQFFDSRSDPIPTSDMSGSITGTAFQNGIQIETETEYGIMKYRGEQRPNMDECGFYSDAIIQSGGGGERLMAPTTTYQMSELARFGSGGGVSLTLGLQHCDASGRTFPGGAHNGLVSMRANDVYSASTSSTGPETADFDCMEPGNEQARFNSSHLLHDFVA